MCHVTWKRDKSVFLTVFLRNIPFSSHLKQHLKNFFSRWHKKKLTVSIGCLFFYSPIQGWWKSTYSSLFYKFNVRKKMFFVYKGKVEESPRSPVKNPPLPPPRSPKSNRIAPRTTPNRLRLTPLKSIQNIVANPSSRQTHKQETQSRVGKNKTKHTTP